MSNRKKIELKIKIKSLSFLNLKSYVICGVKVLPKEFIFKVNQLESTPTVTEVLNTLELIKYKFVGEDLTRAQWYEISSMGRIESWRKWRWAIKPNLILAENYLDFGNKKQKHKLDGYQRFLLCFVEVLLLVNRSYDATRIFLSQEKNYQQITRRKFVDWLESR